MLFFAFPSHQCSGLWRPYGNLRLCFWKFLIVLGRTPMTFSVKILFFAFPSHQCSGLWRSACPHGVLNMSLATLPRLYCVLTATKANHTASEQRPLRTYCVLIVTIVVLRMQ
ncbi:hypothetical protein DPMN_062391 [Dreissena polymorpha]|uniref:Uncharacterized protein n=1 Tax=Dreissena polymorpha TaxID=45954 RepID=A0A9D4HJ99_DREPO|nr:hypothetical protein DPMN_062391 [Dreissena polymorpha]